MHTGDEYLDAKYNYYPELLTAEQLRKAVQTRFPKLPNLESMNRYELFKFYMEHIFPRPQKRGVKPEGTDQRHRIKPKKEKDRWTVPPDMPDPRLKKLGIHFFNEDEVEKEVDRRIRIKAALIAQARGKQSEDIEQLMDEMKAEETPQPSSSTCGQDYAPSTSPSEDELEPSTSTSDDEPAPSTSKSRRLPGPCATVTSTSQLGPGPSATSTSTSQQEPGPSPPTSTSDEDSGESASTSGRTGLKRGSDKQDKPDPEAEPPKKKRVEITWP